MEGRQESSVLKFIHVEFSRVGRRIFHAPENSVQIDGGGYCYTPGIRHGEFSAGVSGGEQRDPPFRDRATRRERLAFSGPETRRSRVFWAGKHGWLLASDN
jgi:hypothetical protein